MKLNTKITLYLLEIALVPLIFMGYVYYSNDRVQIIQTTLEKLDSIAQIQINRLTDVLTRKHDIIALFATKLSIRRSMRDYNNHPTPALQKYMDDNLADAKSGSSSFLKVYLVNPSGIVVSSTDQTIKGKDISSEDYFKVGIKQEDISILKKDIDGSTTQYLVSPLLLDGAIHGVVVVVTDAQDIIGLANDYTGLGKTGETLLAKDDGRGNALFLTPIRFDKHAGLTRVVAKEREDITSVHAIRGEESRFDTLVDYRNIPVFSASRYIPSVGWGIIVKIDQQETLAPINKLELLFLCIILGTGLVITLLTVSISYSITGPIRVLSEGTKIITEGDLGYRINVQDTTEVGTLAKLFNIMAGKLQQSYQNLEQKVMDRTSELQSEKQKTEAILRNMGDAVFVTDEKHYIILINTAAENLFGLSEIDIIGKKISDSISIAYETSSDSPSSLVDIAFSQKKTARPAEALVLNRRDGKKIYIDGSVSPIIDQSNKLLGAVWVFHDITKEREIDKIKSDFVSLASHQLRTPLTGIKWFVQLLEENTSQIPLEKIHEYIQKIGSSNDRLIDLVNDLLSTSRLDGGKLVKNISSCNIRDILQQSIDTQGRTLIDKQIEINGLNSIPAELNVDADLVQLTQVFGNLINNAARYSPANSKIDISAITRNEKVTISIQDHGVGIPQSQQAKMFTKFFRADNVAKTIPGSGLGLYVAKSIVESHGGRIWFESTENIGTTFYVELPLGSSSQPKS